MNMLISLLIHKIIATEAFKVSTHFLGLPFNAEMVPSFLKQMHNILSSCGDHCLLLPIPDNTANIWLNEVHLREELELYTS